MIFRATGLNDRSGKRMGTIVTWVEFYLCQRICQKNEGLDR